MSKGYVNGSDLLLMVGDKCVGHCTSHSVTYNSETKEHAVKPVSTAKKSAGKWKGKTVTGLSISISFEGLCFYEEDMQRSLQCGARVTASMLRHSSERAMPHQRLSVNS